jgi:hypothetical protein
VTRKLSGVFCAAFSLRRLVEFDELDLYKEGKEIGSV